MSAPQIHKRVHTNTNTTTYNTNTTTHIQTQSSKRRKTTKPKPQTPKPQTTTNEDADIDRILDERGNTSRATKTKTKPKPSKKSPSHEYLCSWMDGAEPQWVAAEYLVGTPALEEWTEADNEVEEVHESDAVVKKKCNQFADLLAVAQRPVFLLGAGISSSVLPTFRGTAGLWTKNAHKNKLANASAVLVKPTLAHRALAALEKADNVYWVATQNYDDLSARSGFNTKKLSELHGNIFTETCDDCLEVFHRDFEVPLANSKDHETGRVCEDCGGQLSDNIVHFDEALPWHELKMANCKFLSADLTVVLGSSLRVEPAASLPFKNKRRAKTNKANVVIVNLQPTPTDDEADLIIRANCDVVMNTVASTILGHDWDTKA
eukprot:m.69445 g.69445  ORF g.69445 m.69445 type:complete len:377 (-) comp24093_c0_seq1:165-1295(-)